MNEQQLHYFLKVAEKQNLTQAAQELIISPPALTATLRRLEKDLDCCLFDRKGRNIILSAQGQILQEYAKVALGALASARGKISLSQKQKHLTIGLTSPLVCHDALKAFLEQYPEVQLTHNILRINQLTSPSLKQEVAFVIASEEDALGPGWEGQVIKPDNPLVLAVYGSHPFAGRSSICLNELSGERFIALPQEYSFRRFIDRVFAQAGFSPNFILECDFALRPTMLNAQYGVLLTTASVKNSGFSPGTVFIPVTEPVINYPWYIYRNQNSMDSSTAALFWDFMVSFYGGNTKTPKTS